MPFSMMGAPAGRRFRLSPRRGLSKRDLFARLHDESREKKDVEHRLDALAKRQAVLREQAEKLAREKRALEGRWYVRAARWLRGLTRQVG